MRAVKSRKAETAARKFGVLEARCKGFAGPESDGGVTVSPQTN